MMHEAQFERLFQVERIHERVRGTVAVNDGPAKGEGAGADDALFDERHGDKLMQLGFLGGFGTRAPHHLSLRRVVPQSVRPRFAGGGPWSILFQNFWLESEFRLKLRWFKSNSRLRLIR